MATLSLIMPALQKTTEGKKRKPKIVAGCTPSNESFIFFTKYHEPANAMAEKYSEITQ